MKVARKEAVGYNDITPSQNAYPIKSNIIPTAEKNAKSKA